MDNKLGMTMVLVVTDLFSRFTILSPLKDKTQESVAQELWKIFATFGPPCILQSDNGKEFVNAVIEKMTKLFGIEHRLISSYHPRANGAVERVNRTVKDMLKKHLNGATNWPIWLPFIQYCINSYVTRSHGSTPFAVLFGRAINRLADFSEHPYRLYLLHVLRTGRFIKTNCSKQSIPQSERNA